MDYCVLDPWISTALNNHFDNDCNTTYGQVQEVTSHGCCHVWNVKVFEKLIGGMSGMCVIDDGQLSIKALFTEDAVKTFEKNDALASCVGFWDRINNGIIVLKKYHIMMDVTPQIEQCKLAICVDEFLVPSMSPCRDSLIEAIEYPIVARHIRQIWRSKYNSGKQDSCFTNAFSEDISQQQDTLSQLLELIKNASQSMTSCSETDQGTDEQRPHRGYFELDKAAYNQCKSSEVLKKVIEDVKKMMITSIEDAECVKSKIPETVERGLGCRIHSIPALELVNLTMDVIDPAEYDIPDDIMQKLDNMEEWKVDFVPPCSDRAAVSSSVNTTSFTTQPSVEHHKKDGEEQAQESVTSQRCKRKVALSLRSQIPCKMTKSSKGCNSKIGQEQKASKGLKSNKLLQRIQLQNVPRQEMEAEFEKKKHLENSEAVEGFTQCCNCLLLPSEEDEDEMDVVGFQRKHSSAYSSSLLAHGKEFKRKSQKTCLREEEEQINWIGIAESENPLEKLMISGDERNSTSDESSMSESLLLSCEIGEPNEKQLMNKEQLEELDTNAHPNFSAEFVDCTQLGILPSVLIQQPKSCPIKKRKVKTAKDSNGSQQYVNLRALPTSKLVHTNTKSFKDSQHTSDMLVDAYTQTADTSSKTSGVLNIAQISKVAKTNLKETKVSPTSSLSGTSYDCFVKSLNVRPLNKDTRPSRPAESSLIASLCGLEMCGSDLVVKNLSSVTHSQSRFKERSAIAKSSKRRSTDRATDGDDCACRLKNYKLDKQTLEWCASVARSNVKTNKCKRTPSHPGQ